MLTAEGQKLNSWDGTDQGRFLIFGQDFTVQNSKRFLQRKRGLISVLFNFSKHSCSILNLVIMSEMQSEKFYIENKFSTTCVCRLVLQTFYIKIQKENCNTNISNTSDLTFDVMCFSIEKWCWWNSAKWTNNGYVYRNKLWLKRGKCFDVLLRSYGKQQGKKIYKYK